jgi:hypothetical protein
LKSVLQRSIPSFLALIVMFNIVGYASASSDSSKYQYSGTEFAELEELFMLLMLCLRKFWM